MRILFLLIQLMYLCFYVAALARASAVEDLLDTGEYETVYNLRVADHHTYFVGMREWGFSAWAHNVCDMSKPLDGRPSIRSSIRS